jgi:hypothetical protein
MQVTTSVLPSWFSDACLGRVLVDVDADDDYWHVRR